jgi:hypothetical protein
VPENTTKRSLVMLVQRSNVVARLRGKVFVSKQRLHSRAIKRQLNGTAAERRLCAGFGIARKIVNEIFIKVLSGTMVQVPLAIRTHTRTEQSE